MVTQLNDILLELRTISSLIRGHQTGGYLPHPVEGSVVGLTPREPSEHDTLFAAKLASLDNQEEVSGALAVFSALAKDNQPAPPPLPSTLPRVKWTKENEDLIVQCAGAPAGTYRNSAKFLTDKLKFPLTAIRNKCSRMGYSIQNKYIIVKDINAN